MYARYLIVLTVLSVAPGPAMAELYKCVDAQGKVEYANGPCKGKAEKFKPRKGSVTTMKMPKFEPAPTAGTGGSLMSPEQKQQMEELGIKPGGAVSVKPLVIPESWLK